MRNLLFLACIHLFMWIFVLFRCLRGRAIRYEIMTSQRYAVCLFMLLGLILCLSTQDRAGLLSFFSCSLAGALFQAIPSGFTEEAVYLRGKRILFTQIDEWLYEEKQTCIQVSFHCHYRMYILLMNPEQRDMMLAYRQLWLRAGH